MSNVAFAPEFVRNARVQLRPGRALATIIICAMASLATAAYYNSPVASTSLGLLRLVIFIQIAAVVIAGGIYCLQSIHSEKMLNTFDFQRLTRLTPFELTLGKLLGAPVLTFLIVLCLMPLALWAAFVWSVSFYVLIEIYMLLATGALTFGLLALLTSLLLGRSASAGAFLFYLAVVGMSSIDYGGGNSVFAVHSLSPFFAIELLPGRPAGMISALPPLQDLFFGKPVPHVLTLMIIYGTFASWFLLALLRNIKKDPSIYEIFSPTQALLFVLYLNFLVIGFFRWVVPFVTYNPRTGNAIDYRPVLPAEAERTFLGVALWLFVILGFSLLRNRERMRKRLSEFGSGAAGWWAAIWPAPHLISGILIFGFAVITMIDVKLPPSAKWNTTMGVVEVLFLGLWLARDAIYLQWMCARRTRRPLVSGLLYLGAFYVCSTLIIAAFRLQGFAGISVVALIPSFVFGMDLGSRLDHQSAWVMGLGLLALEAAFFAWLQRRELQALLATIPVQHKTSR